MSKVYSKLDSVTVEKSHVTFLDSYVKDASNKNMIIDVFPELFSIEDSIIYYLTQHDIDNKGVEMKKLINDNIGTGNFEFREIVSNAFINSKHV